MRTDVKWYSPDGNYPTKQHAFEVKVRQNSVGIDYIGNQSLCSPMFLAGDDELAIHYNDIEGEVLNKGKACKTCLNKAKS